MSPSLEYLERCAADSGFAVTTLEKVVRLGEFAGDVGRHAFLKEVLLLKGPSTWATGPRPGSRSISTSTTSGPRSARPCWRTAPEWNRP
jgi:hypothetical protein